MQVGNGEDVRGGAFISPTTPEESVELVSGQLSALKQEFDQTWERLQVCPIPGARGNERPKPKFSSFFVFFLLIFGCFFFDWQFFFLFLVAGSVCGVAKRVFCRTWGAATSSPN